MVLRNSLVGKYCTSESKAYTEIVTPLIITFSLIVTVFWRTRFMPLIFCMNI